MLLAEASYKLGLRLYNLIGKFKHIFTHELKFIGLG